jgi:16S rRNA (cytosine1402-N4)-methyltransferase
MEHTSVLLKEAIDGLDVKESDIVVDGTLGGAGHFAALMNVLGPKGRLIGIDADIDAIGRAQQAISKSSDANSSADENGNANGTLPNIDLANDNFRNLDTILDQFEIPQINKSLFDLGWSSFQLGRGRGFSFQTDEPLLMTYGDPEIQQTAKEVVNGLPEDELVKMLYELGEEQFARRISRAIVDARKRQRIETTLQLVEVIKQGTPEWYHHKRLHPATKTFQALRIYVNDELGALEDVLTAALARTAPGGRIAVITFHSIEDRIVKNIFRTAVSEGQGVLVSKKPIIPTPDELSANPRARSAKLRIFERMET